MNNPPPNPWEIEFKLWEIDFKLWEIDFKLWEIATKPRSPDAKSPKVAQSDPNGGPGLGYEVFGHLSRKGG